MPAQTATREGVVTRRSEAYADIIKSREGQIDQELKESGTTEGLAVLARDVPEGDPLRPEGIPQEDWDAMSDEQKNEEIARSKKVGEKSEVTETDEEKAAREEKEEEDRKAAEAKKVKIKVDGEEREVDEAEVLQAGIRTLQKEQSADKRLEEATKAREEAEKLRKSMEETIGKLPKQEKEAAKPTDVVASIERLKPVIEKVQYGTVDEAAAALAEIINSTRSDGLSDVQIASLVENEVSLREARTFVKTNYPDIIGDSRLRGIFVGEVNAKLAAGDDRPYLDIAKEVADDLKAWRAPQPKAEATPKKEGASRAEVHQRKTTQVQVPSAAARQPAPTQPKAEAPSDVVAKMREDRDRKSGRA